MKAVAWFVCVALVACGGDKNVCHYDPESEVGSRVLAIESAVCRKKFESWTLEQLVFPVYLDPSLRVRSLVSDLVRARPEPALAPGLAATIHALEALRAKLEDDEVARGYFDHDIDVPVRYSLVRWRLDRLAEALLALGPAGRIFSGL